LSSFFSDCHRVALSAVPCQWERIIGSYFGLTSVNMKNIIEWILFAQSGCKTRDLPLYRL
ncbi:hypothetical protein, partial [Lonsdalea quercina]|uniref:hypothetical protein n=1 Tax=Lonsdalea quercina TaxID=71657 RepID=UPI0039765085